MVASTAVRRVIHVKRVDRERPYLLSRNRLAVAKTVDGKTPIQRQIDQLVYELYGLTDDEIRIVEEATQR